MGCFLLPSEERLVRLGAQMETRVLFYYSFLNVSLFDASLRRKRNVTRLQTVSRPNDGALEKSAQDGFIKVCECRPVGSKSGVAALLAVPKVVII